MPRVSNKRNEILEYIKIFTDDFGYPPSVREICKAVGLKSPSSVHTHLTNLVKEGHLRKDSFKTRALVLNTIDNIKTKNVPIVGNVTAGLPILAVENIEEYFPIPENFFTSESTFMLKIVGESMIDAGIDDGDYIVVKQQSNANNGEIIVALIDDSATVKRFFKEDNRIRLQPENKTMSPIYVDNVRVLGKVVGLIRKM